MARANMPRDGFRYAPNTTGGMLVEPIPCVVATSYGTALYPGQAVKVVNDGTVSKSTTGDGSLILGIIDSVKQYRNSDGQVQKHGLYLPASTTWTAWEDRSIVNVIPCLPGVMFIAPADDATTFTTRALAQAAVWENCDAVIGTANTALGLPSYKLDISGHATTNTFQWKLLALLDSEGSDPAGGANYEYIVTCNLPQLTAILGV